MATSTPLPNAATVFFAVGDPDGTRTLVAIVALLAVLGLILVMVAIWLFKRTRPDPEVLAPLEVMSDRAWRKGDPVWQRRRLDEVRPKGAEPIAPSAAPPAVDSSFDEGPSVSGFDDLSDDSASGEAGETDDESDSDDGADDAVPVDRSASTPVDQARPDVGDFSDLFDGDIDPELLAAAMADLDAELQRNDIGTPNGTVRPEAANDDQDAVGDVGDVG